MDLPRYSCEKHKVSDFGDFCPKCAVEEKFAHAANRLLEFAKRYLEKQGVCFPAIQAETTNKPKEEYSLHPEYRVVGGPNELFCVEHCERFRCPICTAHETQRMDQLRKLDEQYPNRSQFLYAGPGWFRTREGSWLRLQNRETAYNIVAKATPELAAILDGLK